MLSPAALAILTVTFAHGRERNIAMGVWGGLAGLGGTLGVVAGGLLVDSLSWQWVFFVNVPIVIALVAVIPVFVRDTRHGQTGDRTFDTAVLGTAGLLAVVYGVVRAEPKGWGSAEVLGFLIGGLVLLGAFVAVEARSKAPLVPLKRDSALEAGVHFLPMGGAAIIGAVLASELVQRLGTRTVQLSGSVLSVAGLLLLSRADATGSYASQLLPGLILFGAGIIGVGVPAQIAAVCDVEHHEAGAASGVVTAVYQVGGALGLAVVTTLSISRTTDALTHGVAQQQALVEGFQRGLLIAAAFAVVNVLVTLATPQLQPDTEQIAEAAVAA